MEITFSFGGIKLPRTNREGKGKSRIAFPETYCVVDMEIFPSGIPEENISRILFPWCVTRVTTISTKGDPPNGGSCSPETHSPRS